MRFVFAGKGGARIYCTCALRFSFKGDVNTIQLAIFASILYKYTLLSMDIGFTLDFMFKFDCGILSSNSNSWY